MNSRYQRKSNRCITRCLAIIFIVAIIGAIFVNLRSFYNWHPWNFSMEQGGSFGRENAKLHSSDKIVAPDATPATDGPPIILWWTDFMMEPGALKQCGDVSCFVTNNRTYLNNPHTQAIMFYGSSFELHDLPLPRRPYHRWAIIHEESPKNNWAFCNEKMMELFNYTATFKRNSDFPLTLIWLTSIEDIESKKYYHTVEEKNKFMKELDLAPIAYIQSDCGAPSDRDRLVEMLSKHIKVDSLGKCLNNKKLPEHLQDNLKGMDHNDFYALLSKYKFVMAAENAICEDYITEKFWRSFYVGTVPIVYGSPTIRDWLPTNDSAIVVQDFDSMKALVDSINKLNNNNTAYAEAISYKVTGVTNKHLLTQMKSRTWKINNEGLNFADATQCYVCEHLAKGAKLASTPRSLQCPQPKEFVMTDESFPRKEEFWWPSYYTEVFKQGTRLVNNLTGQMSAR